VRGADGEQASGRLDLGEHHGGSLRLAFFSSQLPQFADSFADLPALGLRFSMLTLACQTADAVAMSKLSIPLPGWMRSVEAATGLVLVELDSRSSRKHDGW
jgi:hypothetical protein